MSKAKDSSLDHIFSQLEKSEKAARALKKGFRKAAPVAKQNTTAVIAELQKNLDALCSRQGVARVVMPVRKAATPVRKAAAPVLDTITKRDTAGSDPLGSEGLGTRTARMTTHGVQKAEDEIDLSDNGGFTTMSRLTGKY